MGVRFCNVSISFSRKREAYCSTARLDEVFGEKGTDYIADQIIFASRSSTFVVGASGNKWIEKLNFLLNRVFTLFGRESPREK
jgi:hypothetical protein